MTHYSSLLIIKTNYLFSLIRPYKCTKGSACIVISLNLLFLFETLNASKTFLMLSIKKKQRAYSCSCFLFSVKLFYFPHESSHQQQQQQFSLECSKSPQYTRIPPLLSVLERILSALSVKNAFNSLDFLFFSSLSLRLFKTVPSAPIIISTTVNFTFSSPHRQDSDICHFPLSVRKLSTEEKDRAIKV